MYIMLLYMYIVCICYVFTVCFCNNCVCVLWVNSSKSKFPEICFRTYDNSFRILNNFPMTCITKHKFAHIRGARVQILEVVDTSCYFWLSCILLNVKPSRTIFQRATFSNQCTSLRKIAFISMPLMAQLYTFLFPHFHSNCITTNLSVVSNNQE